MQSVANSNRVALDKTQKSFIDQGGGLQRVIAALARHVLDRNSMQFAVDERDQPLESGIIASPPLDEQAGDIGIVVDAGIVAIECASLNPSFGRRPAAAQA